MKELSDLKEKFHHAEPWPYLVIDNFMENTDLLDRAIDAIPKVGDTPTAGLGKMSSFQENKLKDYKLRSTILPIRQLEESIQKVYDHLYSDETCNLLDQLCEHKIVRGLDESLCKDGHLRGAGIHQISKDGFMKVHRDPQLHHEKKWLRPLVGILYLNKDWKEGDGGSLELWDKECKAVVSRIAPIYNRFVIMANWPNTYHGVEIVNNGVRKSFCCFYYTKEKLGDWYPYYFVESADVMLSAAKIKDSAADIKSKRFAAEVAIEILKTRYENFSEFEFYKLCELDSEH